MTVPTMTDAAPSADPHLAPSLAPSLAATLDAGSVTDRLFAQVLRDYGAQISRFAAGYEIDTAKRRELRQEMLLALWQSLAVFKQQCGLRTWVYRVAHNVGVTHIQREKRRPPTVSLDDETLDLAPVASNPGSDGWINGGIVAVVIAIYGLNVFTAWRLQREIDALPGSQ